MVAFAIAACAAGDVVAEQFTHSGREVMDCFEIELPKPEAVKQTTRPMGEVVTAEEKSRKRRLGFR